MSAPDPREAASATLGCPLCGAPIGPNDTRCPDCNMTLDGVGGRPAAFDRQALWSWAAALLALYVVVLLVVVVAR